jgi:hypothetical protein
MIRGLFRADSRRRRPFVTAHLSIPSQSLSGDVRFLVDTGADSTLLAPADTVFLHLDVSRLPQGPPSTGVGGLTRTASVPATLTLGSLAYRLDLRVLVPSRQQQQALSRIPSLLGRDILSRFALILEERTDRVLLLTPDEADTLPLP